MIELLAQDKRRRVDSDVPSHSVVFGNPCIIKHKDDATVGYINNKI